MKLPDKEEFKYKDVTVAGDECWLITPNQIGCKWNEDNLGFRSIVIRKSDHKICSRGFSKFFNWSEKPDLDPFPDGKFSAIAKHDGSLIIWSYYNDEIIHRTRGTVDLRSMDNGSELEFLLKKYPLLQPAIINNSEYSILTEWETKTNIIVINNVEEPTLTLVGVIHNDTGKLLTQTELDSKAIAWGLDRPIRHEFSSIKECIESVETWEGAEGVVLYSEDGQSLRKIKSSWYCELHKLATGIKNIGHVLGVFMESPKFTESEDFYKYIETTLDFEIAEKCKEYINEIVDAYNEVLLKSDKVEKVVESVRYGFSRKEQALDFQSHWKDWRLSYAFFLISGKSMDDKMLKKAMENELKLK